MDFKLTEEHLMIRDAARDFAKQELLPGVIERDNKQEFPKEQVKKMGELGFLGMMVDPKYGGGGMDTVSYVLVMEELSKIDASCSVIVSVNNSLVCYGLQSYANEEQKAYTDSLGFAIPSQDITIGRLNFGPEFAYRMDNPNGGYFEPYVRVNGVWDYDDADVYNSNGVLTSLGDFRADARLGFNAELSNGGIVSGEVSVQGVGENDLEANSAMVRVRLPLSMQ